MGQPLARGLLHPLLRPTDDHQRGKRILTKENPSDELGDAF